MGTHYNQNLRDCKTALDRLYSFVKTEFENIKQAKRDIEEIENTKKRE